MNILDLKRKLLPMSGFYSGGGSSPTSTTTGGLPEWAIPYAQNTLAKQAALSEVPYQAYGGNRIQGFTPMQQNAANQAAGMNAGPEGFSAGISAYMNPYQQNVTDIQKREAARQSGIQGVQQAGQATSSGALGGSRDAIMRAERERNLGQQMNDIQAQGSNAAFNQAANQFRQGITQGIDINRLQSAYGAQQQGMGQRGLDMAYQDFLNQKAYPQTQLSNMANMMHGLPIQQQTTTGTPGSPSGLQQLGSLAQIGYGLSGFFADGGEVSSYADGGSVDSQGNIESIVHKLSDQQLAQAEQSAKARGDAVEMQAIGMEKAARASMKRGIAAAPVDMEQMLPSEESMARGGIVAFAGDDEEGSLVREGMGFGGTGSGIDGDDSYGNVGDNDENPNDVKSLLAGQQKSISELQNLKPRTPKTAEERAADLKEYKRQLMEGVDTTDQDTLRADIKRMQEENEANLKHGKGLAFIQSGAAMLEGNDPWRAMGRSVSTFGQAYGDAVKAAQAKNQALINMKQNLAESQRKEQMGLNKEAILYQDQARRDQNAADKFEVDRLRAMGNLQGNAARAAIAARPPVAKPPTPPKFAEQLAEAEVALAQDPNNKNLQTRVKGLRNAGALLQQRNISSYGTQEAGPGRREDTQAGQDIQKTHYANTDAAAELKKLPLNTEYRKATPERKAEMENEVKANAFAAYGLTPPGAAKPAPAPAKPAPATQIPAGATYGKVVPGKGTEVLVGGKLVGYAN